MAHVSEPLRRMATVVDTVGSSPNGLTSTLIAEITGLPLPTIHRTLRNLAAIRYVENDGQGTPYRLGSRLLRLIQPGLRNEDVAEISEPILQRLADTLGCTAVLARGIANSSGETIVEILPRKRGPSMVLAGHDLPMHSTASGKIFLSTWSEAELSSFLQKKLEALRPATITDPQELRSHLELVRQRGYATCRDECDAGVYAVAGAVRLVRQGLTFAAGAVGLRQNLFKHASEKEVIRLVKDIAQELTARLNGLGVPTTPAARAPRDAKVKKRARDGRGD